MRIYRRWDFTEDFRDKTPAVSPATRQWMDEFICELGEQMHGDLGMSVEYESDLHIVPGIEVSGFIPSTNGGLRLTLWAQLVADADYSHYPPFNCVRDKLDELSEDFEQSFLQDKGIAVEDAPEDMYYEALSEWNNSCAAYVDYILEVWQDMDKVQMQAYISLDDENVVKNTWYVGELPDPAEAAKDLKPIIMAAWERKI